MSDFPVSPLAPKGIAEIPSVSGVRMATAETGIKYQGRHDLLLMIFDEPAVTAGVFTRSRCPSAPVDWCRQALEAGKRAKAVVVNAGNANAFTGKRGQEATTMTASAAAAACNCEADEIYLASTGVIGEPLDATAFTPHLADLVKASVTDGWLGAAKAIMTTDTYPKLATCGADLDGHNIVINGIAKGSGMIAPDMATMLAFVVTDLAISQTLLQSALLELTETTFNSITVDSDTSTSDTLMAFATGAAPAPPLESRDDPRFKPFRGALEDLLRDLALQVVRDGEGATKQVQIDVAGAENDAAAKRIALSIANSPLVKTAVAGEDANWGRIVMAVGKAGEKADRDKLAIWFGNVQVAADGERNPDYDEETASAVMRHDEITIYVDVGIGSGKATVWTCDLTKQYVAINGDYRS